MADFDPTRFRHHTHTVPKHSPHGFKDNALYWICTEGQAEVTLGPLKDSAVFAADRIMIDEPQEGRWHIVKDRLGQVGLHVEYYDEVESYVRAMKAKETADSIRLDPSAMRIPIKDPLPNYDLDEDFKRLLETSAITSGKLPLLIDPSKMLA